MKNYDDDDKITRQQSTPRKRKRKAQNTATRICEIVQFTNFLDTVVW